MVTLKMTKEEKKIFEEDKLKIKLPKPKPEKKKPDKLAVQQLEKTVKRECLHKTPSIPDNREIIIDVSTSIKYRINWFVLRRKLKLIPVSIWVRYTNWFNTKFNKPSKEVSAYFEDNNENDILYEDLPTIPELNAAR